MELEQQADGPDEDYDEESEDKKAQKPAEKTD